jgi:hypothetical protein
MCRLSPFKRLVGVFHRLLRKFVSRQMIALPMRCGGHSVRVRGKLMEFCGLYMRIIWHTGGTPLSPVS